METNKKRKRIEYKYTDKMSLDFISFVQHPAIQETFLKFSTETVIQARFNADKMIVTGPALIPNLDIYRIDETTGEEHDGYFSEDTVRLVAANFLKNNKQSAVNVEHALPVNGVTLIESWIIEDPTNDKASALGYDLPKGTWMCSYKIDNPEFWNDIKSGKVKGFSIEGDFLHASKNEKTEMKRNTSIYKKIKEALGLLKFNEDTLADGTMIATDGEFIVGAQVNVVAADGSQNPIPDGSYTLSDGTIITVMAGVITEVATAEEEAADAEMAAKPAPEAQAPAAPEGQDLQAQVDALKAELDAIKSALGLKEQELATANETLATLSAEKSELEKKVVELSEAPGAETIQKTALAKQIELSKQNENSRLEQFRRLRAAQK